MDEPGATGVNIMYRNYRCILLFVSLGLKSYMSLMSDSVSIHTAPNNNGVNHLYAYDTRKINMLQKIVLHILPAGSMASSLRYPGHFKKIFGVLSIYLV